MKYGLVLAALMWCAVGMAQERTTRSYMRSGNRQYDDSLFVKAEVDYRKAIEKDPKNTDAMYNLANALLMQEGNEKLKEAMGLYESLTRLETDKDKLAQVYHNMGVIMEGYKQYAPAIEAYKQSLRRNPTDNETRYNLALCQKLLKDQPQDQNQDQEQQQQQDKQEDKDQQEQKQNQDQDKQNDQQPPQPEQKQDEMSKENTEQLLNALMQDEKDVQEKVKKQLQIKGKKLDKDW